MPLGSDKNVDIAHNHFLSFILVFFCDPPPLSFFFPSVVLKFGSQPLLTPLSQLKRTPTASSIQRAAEKPFRSELAKMDVRRFRRETFAIRLRCKHQGDSKATKEMF